MIAWLLEIFSKLVNALAKWQAAAERKADERLATAQASAGGLDTWHGKLQEEAIRLEQRCRCLEAENNELRKRSEAAEARLEDLHRQFTVRAATIDALPADAVWDAPVGADKPAA